MRRWIAVLGCVVACLVVLGGHPLPVVANPLMGGRAEAPPSRQEKRSVLPTGVGRSVLKLQQDLNREIGRRMRAIRDGESAGPLIAGLAVAFLYGVVHTLGPGHGKFVVVSYFLSREARIWRGLLMGLQIALTHVIAAIALMVLADWSLKQVLGGGAGEMRTARLVSYGATAAVALFMLARALRASQDGYDTHQHGEGARRAGHGGKQQGLVSLCVGLVPCTGALLIMLFALANDLVFAGSLMVASIAVGMAITMAVLGIVGILARQALVSRFEPAQQGRGRLARALECAGALLILAVSSILFLGEL
jgi:ABC-type nickel/cobalt efflux system permease component RcnA